MRKNETEIDPQIVEAEENFLIDFQFLVQDLIDAKMISRSELAKRAGLTKGRLSQILSAEANPTVKTFARLFQALKVQVVPQVLSESCEIAFPARGRGSNEWLVDKAVESVTAEFSRSRMKEWHGASNDNVTVMTGAKALKLRAA
jgi:transcriptional regulator with XRE-family HTH domain